MAKIKSIPNYIESRFLELLNSVLAGNNINKDNTVIVYGVESGGSKDNPIESYGFNIINGKTLSLAEGIRLGNTNLNVIVIDSSINLYRSGLSNFLNCAKRNINISYFVINNDQNFINGMNNSLNLMSLGIISGATFVARGLLYDRHRLEQLTKGVLEHKGFSFLEIVTQDIPIDNLSSDEGKFYLLEESDDVIYDNVKALERSQNVKDKIPLGIFYKEVKPIYEEQNIILKDSNLVSQNIMNVDISNIFANFVI